MTIFINEPNTIIWRTPDEHYDTIKDVEQDLTGAHQTIQELTQLLRGYMKHIYEIEGVSYLEKQYSSKHLTREQLIDLQKLGSLILPDDFMT